MRVMGNNNAKTPPWRTSINSYASMGTSFLIRTAAIHRSHRRPALVSKFRYRLRR